MVGWSGWEELREVRAVDYYHILEIKRGATRAEMRAAYLRLTAANHPDLNPNSDTSQRIREIQEAYEVLSDLKSRAEYDLNPDEFRNSDVIYDSPRQEPQEFESHPFQSHPAAARKSTQRAMWEEAQISSQRSPVVGLVGVCLAVTCLILGCVVYQRFQADMAIRQSAIEQDNDPSSDIRPTKPFWVDSKPKKKVAKTKSETLVVINEMKQTSKELLDNPLEQNESYPSSQSKDAAEEESVNDGAFETLSLAELEQRLNTPLQPGSDGGLGFDPDSSSDFDEFGGDTFVSDETPSYFPPNPPAANSMSSYGTNYVGSDQSNFQTTINAPAYDFQQSIPPQTNSRASDLGFLDPKMNQASRSPNTVPSKNPILQRSYDRETAQAFEKSMIEQPSASFGPEKPTGPKPPTVPLKPRGGFGGNAGSYGNMGASSSNSGLTNSLNNLGGNLGGNLGVRATGTPGTGTSGLGMGTPYVPLNRGGNITPLPGASNSRMQSLPSYNAQGLNGSF